MTNGWRFGVRWLVLVFMSCVLLACATPVAHAPRSDSAQNGTPTASAWSEVGSFDDHGLPSGVVLWLRAPAAGRDIPLLATLMGIGSMLDPSQVLSQRLGPALGRTVDLSKPLDLTVSGLDAGPARDALAASIGDPSTFLDQVRANFRVVHKSRGRWQLVAKEKTAAGLLVCELWRAAEPVGARLVCATNAELIEGQGEFFMAVARTRVDRANFHAQVPGSAAQSALEKSVEKDAQEQRKAVPKDDVAIRAGQALGYQFVSEFAHDLSSVSWDLTIQRDSVDISQVMDLSRFESLFSLSLSGRSGAPKPVPEAFWHLPNDSDFSLYSEGAEPEPMRRLVASQMHAVLGATAADDPYDVPGAISDQLAQNIGSLALRGGGFEIAFGQDLDRAARVLSEAAEHHNARRPHSGSADPALKKAPAGLGGWALFGIEDDSQAFLQALRDALRLAADKTKDPRRIEAKATPPSPSDQQFRVLPLAPSAGLPAEALHIVVRSEPNPKYQASNTKQPAPPASTYHVIAASDAAQHLWLAISPDEALVLARMRAVLTPDPANTLGANDELRRLAQQPLSGIGFASLAGLTGLGLSDESKAEVLESRKSLKALWALPKRGSTRMPLWITRAQLAKGARRVAVNLRLTPDAIGDAFESFLARASDSLLKRE